LDFCSILIGKETAVMRPGQKTVAIPLSMEL
jgi:hypothetical protein